jgi:hypothetical protein
MYSTEDALNDETLDPNQIPQNVNIGRQYKRLRVASDLSKRENVDIETVGAGAVGLVNLSVESLTENVNPNHFVLCSISRFWGWIHVFVIKHILSRIHIYKGCEK